MEEHEECMSSVINITPTAQSLAESEESLESPIPGPATSNHVHKPVVLDPSLPQPPPLRGPMGFVRRQGHSGPPALTRATRGSGPVFSSEESPRASPDVYCASSPLAPGVDESSTSTHKVSDRQPQKPVTIAVDRRTGMVIGSNVSNNSSPSTMNHSQPEARIAMADSPDDMAIVAVPITSIDHEQQVFGFKMTTTRDGEDTEDFLCNYCETTLDSLKTFLNHVLNHIFVCTMCNFQSFSRVQVITHVIKEHPQLLMQFPRLEAMQMAVQQYSGDRHSNASTSNYIQRITSILTSLSRRQATEKPAQTAATKHVSGGINHFDATTVGDEERRNGKALLEVEQSGVASDGAANMSGGIATRSSDENTVQASSGAPVGTEHPVQAAADHTATCSALHTQPLLHAAKFDQGRSSNEDVALHSSYSSGSTIMDDTLGPVLHSSFVRGEMRPPLSRAEWSTSSTGPATDETELPVESAASMDILPRDLHPTTTASLPSASDQHITAATISADAFENIEPITIGPIPMGPLDHALPSSISMASDEVSYSAPIYAQATDAGLFPDLSMPTIVSATSLATDPGGTTGILDPRVSDSSSLHLPPQVPEVCQVCVKDIMVNSGGHLDRAVPVYLWGCPHCSVSSALKAAVEQHILQAHPEKDFFSAVKRCLTCYDKEQKRVMLARKAANMPTGLDGEPEFCQICQNEDIVSADRKNIGPSVLLWGCPGCSASANKKLTITNHIHATHPTQPPVLPIRRCPVCYAKEATSRIQKVCKSIYRCPHCQRQDSRRKFMIRHIKLAHVKNKYDADTLSEVDVADVDEQEQLIEKARTCIPVCEAVLLEETSNFDGLVLTLSDDQLFEETEESRDEDSSRVNVSDPLMQPIVLIDLQPPKTISFEDPQQFYYEAATSALKRPAQIHPYLMKGPKTKKSKIGQPTVCSSSTTAYKLLQCRECVSHTETSMHAMKNHFAVFHAMSGLLAIDVHARKMRQRSRVYFCSRIECDFACRTGAEFDYHMSHEHGDSQMSADVLTRYGISASAPIRQCAAHLDGSNPARATDAQRYKCYYCNHISRKLFNIRLHLRNIHRFDQVEQLVVDLKYNPARPDRFVYLCPHKKCNFFTRYKEESDCHTCDEAPNMLLPGITMTAHQMRSQIERKYKCAHCVYSNNRLSDMRKHMRRGHLERCMEQVAYQLSEAGCEKSNRIWFCQHGNCSFTSRDRGSYIEHECDGELTEATLESIQDAPSASVNEESVMSSGPAVTVVEEGEDESTSRQPSTLASLHLHSQATKAAATDKNLKCMHCNYITNRRYDVRQHLNKMHGGQGLELAALDLYKEPGELGCEIWFCQWGKCSHTSSDLNSYLQHHCSDFLAGKSVDKRAPACKDYDFYGQDRYSCPHCGLKLRLINEMRAHLRNEHADCEQGAVDCLRNTDEITHWFCSKRICNAWFGQKEKSEEHICGSMSTNDDVNSKYLCSLCFFEHNDPHNVKMHALTSHKLRRDFLSVLEYASSGETKSLFLCCSQQCNFSTRDPSLLTNHQCGMWTSGMETSLECMYCNPMITVKQPSEMKQHMEEKHPDRKAVAIDLNRRHRMLPHFMLFCTDPLCHFYTFTPKDIHMHDCPMPPELMSTDNDPPAARVSWEPRASSHGVQCNYCVMTVPTPAALRYHVQMSHPEANVVSQHGSVETAAEVGGHGVESMARSNTSILSITSMLDSLPPGGSSTCTPPATAADTHSTTSNTESPPSQVRHESRDATSTNLSEIAQVSETRDLDASVLFPNLGKSLGI